MFDPKAAAEIFALYCLMSGPEKPLNLHFNSLQGRGWERLGGHGDAVGMGFSNWKGRKNKDDIIHLCSH